MVEKNYFLIVKLCPKSQNFDFLGVFRWHAEHFLGTIFHWKWSPIVTKIHGGGVKEFVYRKISSEWKSKIYLVGIIVFKNAREPYFCARSKKQNFNFHSIIEPPTWKIFVSMPIFLQSGEVDLSESAEKYSIFKF